MPNAPTPKPYFYYGHRKPSQNRPVVYGGLFTSRKTVNPDPSAKTLTPTPNFNVQNWDPENANSHVQSRFPPEPSLHRLSPIARFIVDAFRKNQCRWGPEIVSELRKLRRVTPNLVSEVLKVENNPVIASKFFAWAGKQKGYRHNFASYNAFAYCLNRNNRFRVADQLPELMDSQGKAPSEKQFEILIRMHIDANRGLRVYYVYEKMKKFGVIPRVFLYNRIMDGLVKTGHLDLALSVYNDFRDNGLAEESVTYMTLIKGLCKAGRIEEMLELLGRMRENLCKPDVYAYTAMVKLFVSEENMDGCLKVWEEMRRDGIEADVMAYGTLVMGLCKGKRVDKAYEVFKEMKEKGVLIDRAIYGALVEAFVDDEKIGQACDLWKDLVDSGYRADLGIYNSLIKGLCQVNQVDKARKLFHVVVQEDLQPDFSTVNPILISYAEMRRMDDFLKLLVQMHELGFSVMDDVTKFFSSLVSREERTMLATEVFGDLKGKGYCSISIYSILMQALWNVGEVKRALALFHEVKDSNLDLDSSTYSLAIQCLVDNGEVQEASECYNKIMEMSCLPSLDAYCSLAKGLCKIGEIDASMMLVRDCLANVPSSPMEFKYCLTIIHFCKLDDADKIIEILDEMLDQGCPPSEVAYSSIIYGMCKYGSIEGARNVFSRIREREFLTEAEVIVYDETLIEFTKKKTADLVLCGVKFFGLESKLKAKGCNLLPA